MSILKKFLIEKSARRLELYSVKNFILSYLLIKTYLKIDLLKYIYDLNLLLRLVIVYVKIVFTLKETKKCFFRQELSFLKKMLTFVFGNDILIKSH